jgi:peptidyl-prolyl cis-trans isomerase C
MQFTRQPASRLTSSIAALLAAAIMALSPASGFAQDATAPASPDTVVATVGGEPITEADIAFAAEDLSQELSRMPPEERKAFLVTVLIDMKVMAKAAREAQMDQTPLFKQRLDYLEDRALRRAYFADAIAAAVTPEAVQAAYEEYVAEFQGQPEVRARHILVATEDEAKAVKAELEGGRDFAELAKEKSTDPSAQQNGGDLGFFGRGMMVKPFEDAAFAMQPGQISEPIQSDFGWHVIELEESRTSQAPDLEQLAPQLQQQVMYQTFEKTVADLKSRLEIAIPDAALAAAVDAQTDDQAAAQ